MAFPPRFVILDAMLMREVDCVEEPKVSIIVPVYNVAPYLEQCLSSIRAQSCGEFEVLLVNDGSTDGGADICRAFAAADPRFLLLEQGNAGVSAARNLAMDRARGQYLQFVDGDDYLAPDAVECFLRAARASGCDMAVSHFYRLDGGRCAVRGHIKAECSLNRLDYAQQMMKAPANFYYGVMWNKFYRRAIVEAHRLRCPEGVAWCEDFLFNLDYLACSRLITCVPRPLYYYRKRSGGAVSTQATLRKTIATKRMTFNEYKELYQELDLYEKRKAGVYRYLISSATDGSTGLFPMPRAKEKHRVQ